MNLYTHSDDVVTSWTPPACTKNNTGIKRDLILNSSLNSIKIIHKNPLWNFYKSTSGVFCFTNRVMDMFVWVWRTLQWHQERSVSAKEWLDNDTAAVTLHILYVTLPGRLFETLQGSLLHLFQLKARLTEQIRSSARRDVLTFARCLAIIRAKYSPNGWSVWETGSAPLADPLDPNGLELFGHMNINCLDLWKSVNTSFIQVSVFLFCCGE